MDPKEDGFKTKEDSNRRSLNPLTVHFGGRLLNRIFRLVATGGLIAGVTPLQITGLIQCLQFADDKPCEYA